MDFEQLFAKLQAAGTALTAKQIVTLVLAFGAVVALVIGSAYWINTPSYVVLFSDMDAESASAVVAKLKTSKVDYAIDSGGRTVRVPASKVDELRLDFTSQGLPTSGRVGFEIFDRTAFGVTDFLEQVNYRRALEGELARTISTIGDVAGVRVHIAMPKPSLFSGQDQPTKASVVLKLRNNKRLPDSTVNAITGLVAASVESLRPENVVVVDNMGRPLAKSMDGGDETDGLQLERQQQVEHELSSQVVSMLEPILGAGRVRVTVAARINHDSQEETEEKWDPETTAVRSHQTLQQAATSVGATLGVAGARANTPPDPNKPATAAASLPPGSNTNATEVTNYEVSKLTRHRIQPRGQIARLSVAVIVDDEHPLAAPGSTDVKTDTAAKTSKPRSAESLQKVHDLVAAAVGLDKDRGDQITVENIAFEEVPVENLPTPSVWQNYGPTVVEYGRSGGVMLIAILALLFVIRPMVSGAFSGAAAPAPRAALGAARPSVLLPTQSAGKTVQELENEIDAQLQSAADQNPHVRLPVLTKRVAALAQREPESTARLLRTWLQEGPR